MNIVRALAALVLVAALILIGCDSDGSSIETSAGPEFGFTATIAPGTSQARTLEGDATASDDLEGDLSSFPIPEVDGFRLTAISLTPTDEQTAIVLLGVTDGPPEPATFSVPDLAEPQEGELGPLFAALYYGEQVAGSVGQAFGRAGTVTLTETSETQVRGTFRITFGGLGPGNDAEEFEVEGTFTAEAALGQD